MPVNLDGIDSSVKNVQVLDAEAELSMRGFIHHLKLLFLDLSP